MLMKAELGRFAYKTKINRMDLRALLSLLVTTAMMANFFSLMAVSVGAQSNATRSGGAEGQRPAVVGRKPPAPKDDPSPRAVGTFSNTNPITIQDTAAANPEPAIPYPSNITVSLAGTVTSLTLAITGFSHQDPNDVDMLLVGPAGQKYIFWSDVGGATDVTNLTVTASDGAAGFMPAPLTSGTFKPTNNFNCLEVAGPPDPANYWPAPAPSGPHPTAADSAGASTCGNATLNGTFGGSNPNGTWSLYVIDDTNGETGSISGGWSLTITTASAAATTTTIASSQNPSLRNQPVTFTATVTSGGAVTEGTVTFKDGGPSGTNLTCTGPNPATVNGSGQATCTVAANGLSEGDHTIAAVYNGTANFGTSNGSLNQRVDNATVVTGSKFCNPGPISIPTSGTASTPYPSNLFVTGLSGTVSKITVELNGFGHQDPDDVDVMLVGPGQNIVLMSDAGGNTDVTGLNFVFDDVAAATLSDGGPLVSGTFKPSNFSPADSFPAPAPAPSANTLLSIFNGANPNNTWSLYVVDDVAPQGGQIASGWCINFTTTGDSPTTTTLTAAPNPALTTQPITLTAAVTSSSAVNVGTVTFHEGPTDLTCTQGAQPRPVSGGQALCTVIAGTFPEGSHTITADYSGSPGQFNTSTDTDLLVVDNPTTVTGLEFCNTGPLSIPGSGAATPYPSNITVSGVPGTLSKVTVELHGYGHTDPDDVDVLLVGPGGQNIVLMSDTGGTTDVSGIELTFDDAAAADLPDGSPIVSGTFKPTNFTPADSFPAPAPAPSGSTALSVFNGGNPNGVWKLYVFDDVNPDSGQIAGGWCLNFEVLLPPPDIFLRDARAAEPASGTSNMLFTVALSEPAPGPISVNFATANDTGGANPATAGTCGAGGDYVTTSGTVNFTAGQLLQTIAVPICSDATVEPDETLLVNLSVPVNGNISDGQAVGTITAANTPGEAQITEIRTSGPGGTADEFIELYNNSDAQVVVDDDDGSGGVGLFKMGAACGDTPVLIGTIPNGTIIPARGHYLFVGSTYSLTNYGGVGAAAANAPLTSDIENDRNIGFFATIDVANLSSETRLDAVGFGTNTGGNCDLLREGTNLQPALGSTSQHSFVRKMPAGLPQDTNDNAADFGIVATDPTVAVGSNPTPILGAPGPENLASPIQRNATVKASLIDTAVAASAVPNRVRDLTPYNDTLTPSAPNGGAPATNPYTLGTLLIRRKFTNNTGASVTRLRFRIVDITSTNAAPGGGGQADLRALSSVTGLVTITGGGSVTVQGITLEQPPTQARGGGLNSSVITLATPIANGANINVNFLLGVATGGTYRFFINVEALP